MIKNSFYKTKNNKLLSFDWKKPSVKQTVVTLPNVKYKKTSIIPLNIFQTWHTLDLPPKMKENVELLKKQNPEFTYYLYDDNMCRQFIKDNFDEDVLYTFDKLNPGAYKADIWRYCVLYIHGGIYLDIKYKCINGFKLIEITDKEYYVQDRITAGNRGIYQALMVNMPYNTVLLQAIKKIVEYCKNNTYTNISPLCVTGPGLLATLLCIKEIDALELVNIGDIIVKDGNQIMNYYPEYRNEQSKTGKTGYYHQLWRNGEIYNYPTLQSNKNHIYTRRITKNIMGKNTILYSGTPSIIELTGSSYLININWNNYTYNKDGSKNSNNTKSISLNSRFTTDLNFKQLTPEIFLEEENYEKENKSGFAYHGLADMQLFNYNNIIYYIATYYDHIRKTISMSSNEYNISDKSYTLTRNIILPKMYDTNRITVPEKNWSFFEYKNEHCIVYKWFPLQIGKINYNTHKMDIIEIKYNIPDIFKDGRGSTPGYTKNNEIWFVLHKQSDVKNRPGVYNYQHFFAVFDLDMKLIKYSELLMFGDCKVEFCNGLIVKDDKIIVSYSLLDYESIISEYETDYINTKIKWYNHNTQ